MAMLLQAAGFINIQNEEKMLEDDKDNAKQVERS